MKRAAASNPTMPANPRFVLAREIYAHVNLLEDWRDGLAYDPSRQPIHALAKSTVFALMACASACDSAGVERATEHVTALTAAVASVVVLAPWPDWTQRMQPLLRLLLVKLAELAATTAGPVTAPHEVAELALWAANARAAARFARVPFPPV